MGYCCYALEIWQRRFHGPLSKGILLSTSGKIIQKVFLRKSHGVTQSDFRKNRPFFVQISISGHDLDLDEFSINQSVSRLGIPLITKKLCFGWVFRQVFLGLELRITLTTWWTRIPKIIIQGAGNVEKCEQIADVDPYVVSKNLGIYANSVRSYGRHKALNVYISAPPSQPILKCILERWISDNQNDLYPKLLLYLVLVLLVKNLEY